MQDKRATLEIIAPSVEEAIAKGLADLGLPEEAVEVEVLDQGSRGLFGIGSRQARIRLAVKSAPSEERPEPERVHEAPAPIETFEEERETIPEEAPAPRRVTPADEMSSPEEEHDLQVARDTVSELLEKMKIRARVSAHFGEADEERTRIPIHVDVNGNDLSILIGRRAETLNALQYIASLIVSKELDKSVSLVVDVEGYRMRREGQLRQLARRMAEQAVKTGRRQVLEPMPANERRIVHIELRENPDVSTESIGEEPRRKVTIIPKD
ncbi:MAG: protein jag [Chloroflexota bacterium]|nr:MAG: protein jag [Chloroflexota bacterium]